MRKQQKLSDFVLQLDNSSFPDKLLAFSLTKEYARKFSKKPELGYFIPCDEDGKPLEEPIQGLCGNEQYEGCEMDAYQQALSRCIYKGFELTNSFVEMGHQCNSISNGKYAFQFIEFDEGAIMYGLDFENGVSSLEDLAEYGLEIY